MVRLRDRYGPWALVTGASAGIGAEFARQLAAQGLNLVLVARRGRQLRTLANHLQQTHQIAAQPMELDLTQPDFMPALQTVTADMEIGLLVSCAGFSVTGALIDNDLTRQLEMLHLNTRAPLLLAHTYGRTMKQRGRGGVILVSSIVGFVATPLWTAYSATKAYSLFLAEGLYHELRPHGVDVLALCPGTTRTEFLDVANITGFLPMDVDTVVSRSLKSLGRRATLVPGWHNRLLAWLPRLLPRSVNSWASGLIVKYMTRHR